MMTENSILKLIALISAFSIALFGVDYYSLLYAFIGALLMLSNTKRMSRLRAVGFVVLSTLAGAVLGNGVVIWLHQDEKIHLMVACLVAGGGAQRIVAALLGKWLDAIRTEAIKEHTHE